MFEADIYLMVLYYVNVLQPVEEKQLRKRLRQALPSLGLTMKARSLSVAEVLRNLEYRRLVSRRGGLLITTGKGFRRLGALGVARSRDNGRLFFLSRMI